MDQRLVDQSIAFHGPALLDALEREDVNVSLPNFLTYSHKIPANADRPRDEQYNRTIAQFVAQKADLLFSKSSRPDRSFYDPHLQENDLYAVLPPIEAFMDVPFGEKRTHFFRSVDRGHVVFGQVLALQESGLIIAILAVEYGPIRELDQLKVVAFCPIRETPLLSHQNIADFFQIKDFVRGVVMDVSPEDERIGISLLSRSLPREMTHVKMGLVTDDEIPLHFRRLRNIGSRGYGDHLKRILGFANPSAVDTLSTCLGIPTDNQAPSLMRGLRGIVYPKNQYAEVLRKEQSYRWAIKSVAEGVAKFKAGNHLEAMQLLNKALQIDESNVEAMVARGAIYANNESYDKAIDDFEDALKINSEHKNARKYLCEVMMAKGAECMDDPKKIDTAVHSFQRILDIDPSRDDARGMLRRVHELSQKSEVSNVDLEEKSPSRRRRLNSGTNQDSGSIRKSTDTLRRIIAEDEKSKKSRKSHRRHLSHSPEKRRSRSRSSKRSKNKSRSRSPKSSHKDRRSPSPRYSRRSRSPKVSRNESPDKTRTSLGKEMGEEALCTLKGVPEQYLKIAEDAGLSRAELEDFLKKIDVPTCPGGSTILGLDGTGNPSADTPKVADETKGTDAHQEKKRHAKEPQGKDTKSPSLPKGKAVKKLDVEVAKVIGDFTLPSKEDLMKPEVLAQLMKNLPEEGYNQLAKVFESMKKEDKETKHSKKFSRSPERSSVKKGDQRKSKGTPKGRDHSRSRGRSPAKKSSIKKKITKTRRRYSTSSSSSSSSSSGSSSSGSSSSSSSESSPRRGKGSSKSAKTTAKGKKTVSKTKSKAAKSPEVNTDVRKITMSFKKKESKPGDKLPKSHITITTDSSGSRNISEKKIGYPQPGFGKMTPVQLKIKPDPAKVTTPVPPSKPAETRVVTTSKATDKAVKYENPSENSARGRGFPPGFIPRGVRFPGRRGGRGFDKRGRGTRGRGFQSGLGSEEHDHYDSFGRGARGGRGARARGDFRGRGGFAGRTLPIRGRGRGSSASFKRESSRDRSRSRDRQRRYSRSRYDRSSSEYSYSRSRSRSRGRYRSRSRSLSRSRDRKPVSRMSRFERSRSRTPPKKSSNGDLPKSNPKAGKPEKKESLDEMIVFFNDLKKTKTPNK